MCRGACVDGVSRCGGTDGWGLHACIRQSEYGCPVMGRAGVEDEMVGSHSRPSYCEIARPASAPW